MAPEPRVAMTNKYDQTFLKHFAQLLGGLMALTVVFGFIGHAIYSHMPKYEIRGSHYSFTDHWIRVVKSGEPYPA